MWLNDLFGKRKKPLNDAPEERDPQINRGVFYLYLILVLQVFLVFGILAGIMFVGQVISTPLWVFALAIALGVWGVVYVYRKAKQQLRKIRDAFQHANLSDRNYEISFMGGVLTMRVEQNSRQLLEAPATVLDAEAIETPALPPLVGADPRAN